MPCPFLDLPWSTDVGFRESIHLYLNYIKSCVRAFFWGKGLYSSVVIHDSPKANNDCSVWSPVENQLQWMSVNFRPTFEFCFIHHKAAGLFSSNCNICLLS